MPRCRVLKTVPIARTARVMQLEGMFDVPPAQRSETEFEVELPIEARPWNIGLIVGPSGSGKTSIIESLYPARRARFDWPDDASLIDGFPESMPLREIVEVLSSVGFSSPPAWLRPFRALSNGEQFRAHVARSIAESPQLAVIDEFTSVVDRTVAKIGSAAVAKSIRRRDTRLVAASCHYDVIDWLQPDWIFDTLDMRFTWRDLQRIPTIELYVVRVQPSTWIVFRNHHYLSRALNASARCFVALIEGRPAAFTAVLPFPHARRPGWKEHRTVCLPDFQGVGIGNAMSEFVAGMYRSLGRPYFSVTSHPAMIRHRARSPLWLLKSSASYKSASGRTSHINVNSRMQVRPTSSFEYIGPTHRDAALGFGLLRRS